MFDFIIEIIIVLIIVIGRMIIFGKATWKASLLYGVAFAVIYIFFHLDTKFHYNIKLFYYKLMIVIWALIVIIVELRRYTKK